VDEDVGLSDALSVAEDVVWSMILGVDVAEGSGIFKVTEGVGLAEGTVWSINLGVEVDVAWSAGTF
jgi:hypothetical protein